MLVDDGRGKPGVNHLGSYGRWAFQELTDVHEIEREFGALIDAVATVEVR